MFCALIETRAQDSEELEWKELAKKRLGRAWQGDEDALYDYL